MKRTKTIQDVLDKSWRLPKSEQAVEAMKTFSPTEKAVFGVFVLLFIMSAVSLLWKVNNAFLVTVPERGGTLEEGIIGSPRFLNPLLAISDADRDLTTLTYSGLLKAMPDGSLVPDLAESFSVSPDGLVYTFVLRDGAVFHDGTRVTADDVEFTVLMAQDPGLKSPKRANWEGVSVEKASDREIRFALKAPYAPFIENATLGVLPKHIWQNITADEFPFSNFNVEPIGSGPYKVKDLKRDSGGIPIYYHLKPFDRYALGKPYIENLIIKFYDNPRELSEAYDDGSIESMHNVSAGDAGKLTNSVVSVASLPRVFGVFFNQNQAPVFTSREVRQALSMAVDKDLLVQEILRGYGTAIDGPIPGAAATSTASSSEQRLADAAAVLEKAGWKKNESGVYEKASGGEAQPLKFSISTSNAPELKRTAELVADGWRRLGAEVDVLVFELGDLNQEVIRSRKYDALLFGQVVGRESDLYPFWHSSQRNDPGLNVAQYANVKTDKLLEEARAATDPAERKAKNAEFAKELEKDYPAVFLYSPSFIYALPPKVKGAGFGTVVYPADRFLGVTDWYVETNRVWSVFADKR